MSLFSKLRFYFVMLSHPSILVVVVSNYDYCNLSQEHMIIPVLRKMSLPQNRLFKSVILGLLSLF